MSIDAIFKSKLKQNTQFSIYNINLNQNVDINGVGKMFHHVNFNEFQLFKFIIDGDQKMQEKGFYQGYFLSKRKHKIWFDSKGNARELKQEQFGNQNANIAIKKNDEGLISIHQVEYNKVKNTLSWKNKNFNCIQGEYASFEWYFLEKVTTQFANKDVIISSFKNQNYAISSKSGERFVKLDLFNMYNKSEFAFKAKLETHKFMYSFEQINGENCLTATNSIVQYQNFKPEFSQWTVIKNFLKDEYFFLSMKFFTYLTNAPQPVGLILSEPNFVSGNQSFKLECYQESSSKVDEENVSDDGVSGYAQMPNGNNISNKQDQRYIRMYEESEQYQANLLKQTSQKEQNLIAKNWPNNQNSQALSISQSSQQDPKKYYPNLHSVDIFKSSSNNPSYNNNINNGIHQKQLIQKMQQEDPSQIQKFLMLNMGSQQYLVIKEQFFEINETMKREEATAFEIQQLNSDFCYILYNKQQMIGSNSDSPVTPIKLLEKNIYPNLKLQMKQSSEKSSYFFIQGEFNLQIIGGKLYKSSLKPNLYSQFMLQRV